MNRGYATMCASDRERAAGREGAYRTNSGLQSQLKFLELVLERFLNLISSLADNLKWCICDQIALIIHFHI